MKMKLSHPMTIFRSTSFRRQLSLVTSIAILSIAIASTIVSSWQGSRQTRQTLINQGLTLAGSMAEQSRLALLTGAAENAREAIAGALAFPDVVRVDILLANGHTLLSSDGKPSIARSLVGLTIEHPYLEEETAEAWRFVAPVRVKNESSDPYTDSNQRAELLGYVSVIQGKTTLTRLVSQLIAVNVGVGLAFTTLFLWLLRAIARRLARPLNNLALAMAGAECGQRGLRAEVSGPRDIAHMAHAFNSMMAALEDRERELEQKNDQLTQHAAMLEQRVSERTIALKLSNTELQHTLDTLKTAQESLIATEKQASLGRLVAGVAHELNTPLGNSLTVLSTLDEEYRQLAGMVETGHIRRSDLANLLERSRYGLQLLTKGIQRAATIVQDFKQIAVDQTSEKRRKFDLAEVIREVLSSVQPSFKPTPFHIETALEPGIEMDSFPGPLGQVITNIALNALLHAFPGRTSGILRVSCRRIGEKSAQLLIHDDGVGMTDDVLHHIFDPFFTTKFGQGGSGLGMHIVHGIVTKLLGGGVVVDSVAGQGACFTVTLPLISSAVAETDLPGFRQKT